jgi:LacI family repressor for deo operon, udp, cdd, tsx, nupC, and nupG
VLVANIRDIARLAGVSTATVSRTLARPQVVAPETRARVEAAVARLQYAPNALARGLRRQKSGNIVVVVPDIQNPFFATVVQGIENVAHAHGYKVLLGESQNRLERLDSYWSMTERKEADGLILLGALVPTALGKAAAAGQVPSVPAVMACEYLTGLRAPNVRIDNAAAAAGAIEHLVALGHARIAVIAGPAANPLVKDRLKGARQALAGHGLPLAPDAVARGDFSVESGYLAMQKLLDGKWTAIACHNDEMAIGAIRALREAGRRVPQDVSVVGFDDIRFAQFADPPLTTVRQPQREIGETAMRLVIDLFAGRQAASQVVLPYELVVRESTRAPHR